MEQRRYPSVDRLVKSLYDRSLPRSLVIQVVRQAIADARDRNERGDEVEKGAARVLEDLRLSRPIRVINATGVLLHTNLGRAPWDDGSVQAGAEVAAGYSNTELNLAGGDRGGRAGYLHRLMGLVTGAEAALVVNNNAGALLLALMALASGKEVPVSRSELIEIGGSYRLPDLMAASGARLVEVGTTNRTRTGDYQRAVNADTAVLLKVHPSNYRIVGFSEEATLPQLSSLASSAGIPLVFDAGSGLIDDRVPWWPGPPPSWLSDEPGVVQSLKAGADLVLFSGDKLFGGPQAGIIVGRAELVSRLRRHPAARALRIDGPTAAALGTTAEAYADGRAGDLPFWQMAGLDPQVLEQRICRLIEATGIEARVEEGAATPGAGSVPGAVIPGPVMAIGGRVDQIFVRLLRADPPVVARRERGTVESGLADRGSHRGTGFGRGAAGGMPVIGTAGHVDHGKSTLIAALTGIDPDRWEEERRRGLTIDLGFAWMGLPGGRTVSFVDVPGHERFIKNMLAGIEAIDAALFLVAANEGWMPQSEEHLAVLDLLEVSRGVVALTKVDLVDEEMADLVEMDTVEQLADTIGAQWPVVRVSAPLGEGVAHVAQSLEDALAGYRPEDLGRPRLWIDRAFSIKGAGTVVTGTLLEGKLAVGDRVEVWPDRRRHGSGGWSRTGRRGRPWVRDGGWQSTWLVWAATPRKEGA